MSAGLNMSDRKSPRMGEVLAFLKSKGQVTTGVHGQEGGSGYDGDVTVSDIASAAEFGLGQPQRSWLRAWFDENRSQIESQLSTQLRLALSEGHDFEWGAERFALWMQADIQRRIRNGIAPENHPMTIAKKGSSTPLIDTGLFRSSVVSYFKGARV